MSQAAIDRLVAKYSQVSAYTVFGEPIVSLTKRELVAVVAMYIEREEHQAKELISRDSLRRGIFG